MDRFRFDRLQTEHEFELVRIPFELRPDMPREGFSAEEQGIAHSARVEEYLRRVARDGAIPLVLPDHVPNTHLALTLGEFARGAGPETFLAVHRAIFDARYGRGLDVGSKEVLLAIAEAAGLSRIDAECALDELAFEERLRDYRRLALYLGVVGTPAALVCNELLIGSRPYRVLKEALERCLVTPTSVEQSP